MSTTLPQEAASSRRFGDLRGVQWRIDLGILPSSPDPSIHDLRRVTADFRRRYASLRRQLLIDPHVPKDGSNYPDIVMDNPLSQNPDSMWSRFFRNAELERMVDQDLSRLYPEHGSYFQTPGCQAMLRRILLLWCLRHPEYGYRQAVSRALLWVRRIKNATGGCGRHKVCWRNITSFRPGQTGFSNSPHKLTNEIINLSIFSLKLNLP